MKNAIELLEYIGINDHAIELKKRKQLPIRAIYSLRQMELKILKTYIKANLANGFIRLSKSSARVSILFD